MRAFALLLPITLSLLDIPDGKIWLAKQTSMAFWNLQDPFLIMGFTGSS
jgi:hypothetical protein